MSDFGATAVGKPVFSVTPAAPADADDWKQFLEASNDGTLQHDLDFLAYHSPGRFAVEHLIVRRESEIVAIVPGGTVKQNGAKCFVSPLGASVGGPVMAKTTLADALSVVDALQEYAGARRWVRLEFVLGPAAYRRVATDTTAFALFARGFALTERDLTFIVPVVPGVAGGYATLFRKKQAWSVRAAERRGVTVAHGGVELIEPFFDLFRETYSRHGASATHSEAEIADLLHRLPGRVEITVASSGETPLAAILVFRLNDRAAQTFYICSSKEHAKENGTVAALSALIDRLAGAGVRALDLGPSASALRINEGVVFFKEGLGAAGQARDRWTWDVR